MIYFIIAFVAFLFGTVISLLFFMLLGVYSIYKKNQITYKKLGEKLDQGKKQLADAQKRLEEVGGGLVLVSSGDSVLEDPDEDEFMLNEQGFSKPIIKGD